MQNLKELIYPPMTAALTKVLKNTSSLTCVYVVHQPKLPGLEEFMNNAKKS